MAQTVPKNTTGRPSDGLNRTQQPPMYISHICDTVDVNHDGDGEPEIRTSVSDPRRSPLLSEENPSGDSILNTNRQAHADTLKAPTGGNTFAPSAVPSQERSIHGAESPAQAPAALATAATRAAANAVDNPRPPSVAKRAAAVATGLLHRDPCDSAQLLPVPRDARAQLAKWKQRVARRRAEMAPAPRGDAGEGQKEASSTPVCRTPRTVRVLSQTEGLTE
ncbi:hypothetical protein STCU_09947 [Strigomonas culicis]|uniref:Uncharacterized protein n=1 Tax=Strigomonas culicis TaxID=28005 RepID=S9TP55_9TRYP|nr:hypothetical protein STCU_09947 [Strigomonas culicis]|eukprot:EPY18479.1 hypothetical protein STCU_09947 [Strigomonas culicis]